MTTIPASQLVNVNPSVLASGGSSLEVIGLMLTQSTRAPIGSVLSFPDAASVAAYFGAGSTEAINAGGGTGQGSGYFAGFSNRQKIPSAMLFAQYNAAAVSAYVRGASVASLTLAQLQAISGSLGVTFDGYARNAPSVNLAAATSFSNAASIIQTALNAAITTVASITGSISGTTLSVTATNVTSIAAGQTVSGTGVTAATIILSQLSGSVGGTGTYLVNTSQTALSAAMTTAGTPLTASYDSTSGAFVLTSGITGAASSASFGSGAISDTLNLRALDGAVLSQGAAAASPATFMNALVITNQNWVTFGLNFNPDSAGQNSVKQAFADWAGSKNNRFVYVCRDTDVTPTTTLPAAASLGQVLAAESNSGTVLIYEPDGTDLNTTAFFMGAAASIDFTQTNGRITFAYKSQSGMVAGVSDPTIAANLGGNPQTSSRGNGYNFYGAYATANPQFTFFQRGFITGPFLWADGFINQVWMNSAFQIALLTTLSQSRAIPYGPEGNSIIEASLADPIAAALNFGAFGPAALGSAQIALVNADAGKNIADTLQTQGYYLLIGVATPTVRTQRTSPPCKFYYIDRGAVQAINLQSIALL